VGGEIAMEILTDFPERLKPGVLVYVGQGREPMRLRSRRQHKGALLVAFEQVESREQAGELRNQLVAVRADDRPPLPEGEYYHHQLLGLSVFTEDGRRLGSLAQIMQTKANDVYVVRSETGEELLLPAIDSVILSVDLERQEIRVHLLPGLVDEEEAGE
jgi:16S rRNA processing protein RimM